MEGEKDDSFPDPAKSGRGTYRSAWRGDLAHIAFVDSEPRCIRLRKLDPYIWRGRVEAAWSRATAA